MMVVVFGSVIGGEMMSGILVVVDVQSAGKGEECTAIEMGGRRYEMAELCV